VASTREMSREANRTQMIIGGIAIAVIVVIVIVGLVINRQQNSSPVTDHPLSTNSTASVDNGVITVTGGNPAVTIDMYEDGICPACREFEGQYGQQMMKAVDEGKLAIRYHFLDFLNPNSASKTYSSRAAAAFNCVAAVPPGQAPKGLFLNFHTTMFSAAVQPAESSGKDLSNAEIAAIAGKAGAPASATACITAGTGVAAAQAAAKADQTQLNQIIGANWGTPTVLRDGKPVGINSNDWLTDMLG
jgi:protein-disulfide isomerase